MSRRFPLRLFLVIGSLGAVQASLLLAAPPEQPQAVVVLANDGTLAGALISSSDPHILRWQSPAFTQPLDFPLKAVKRVSWPVSGRPPAPTGEYCFELIGDDRLFGNLLAIAGDVLEIDCPRFGRLHVRRDSVRRFFRWNGAEMVYFGPHGLEDWKDLSSSKPWREEGGSLATNQYDAALFGSPGLPDKAKVEIELSWKTKPDFVFELGVEDKKGPFDGIFRLEVWDNELVLVGETKRDADLISLQPAPAGEGKAHIQIYLDQATRQAIVLSRSGQVLGTLKIDSRNAHAFPGVRLTNKAGDVRLEALRISRWNGTAPKTVNADKGRLHRADGSVVFGRLKSFDPKTRQFTLVEADKDVQVEQKNIVDVFLDAPASSDGKAPAERKLRVVYRDGSRLSGTLAQLGDKQLTLNCPDVKEPLKVAVADLQTLIGLQSESKTQAVAGAGRLGKLKLAGASLDGRLVDSPDGKTGAMTWQPELALHPGVLKAGVSGGVVYREPPPPAPPEPEVPAAPPIPRGGFGGFMARLFGSDSDTPRPPKVEVRKSLHLRSGDVIPCDVTSIDERGVTFKSPLATTSFVPADKIKSVELVPTSKMPKLDEAKRDRLLTLPRLQKDTPPTHLICSTNGDFLRGRILSMNDKMLKVEVRLEVREIPRDRVAQIIWLHPDEIAGSQTPATPKKRTPVDTRIQVLRADGNRLTFDLKKSTQSRIAGTSEILGSCHADLADVDQVLFGDAIAESAAKLAYNLWKLHNAAEPRYVTAGAGGDGSDGEVDGKSSPLVGQPAFPFKLPMLDGRDFDLAAHKGKIVVLDFWATWCGPCMQTAPLFEEVMSQFAGRDVELIGVNMEEQPEQIKSIMQRHKLKFQVALDRDGGVATRYAVTAIPQTVVIGRDGKVVRLFVGGGKKTADALRKTIEELLAPKQ
jgi:peroxiredoxin